MFRAQGDKLSAVSSLRVTRYTDELRSALGKEIARKGQFRSRYAALWPVGTLMSATRRSAEEKSLEEQEWCELLERSGVPRAKELHKLKPVPLDEESEQMRDLELPRRSSSASSADEHIPGGTIRLPIQDGAILDDTFVRPMSLTDLDNKHIFALASGKEWCGHPPYDPSLLSWGRRAPPKSNLFDHVVQAIGDPGPGGVIFSILTSVHKHKKIDRERDEDERKNGVGGGGGDDDDDDEPDNSRVNDDGRNEGGLDDEAFRFIDSRVVGCMSAYAVSGKDLTCRLGRWLMHPSKMWGREHVAALMLVLDHILVTCHFLRVEVVCEAPGEVSGDLAKLIELGFSVEGAVPGAGRLSTACLRMLRGDWLRGEARSKMLEALRVASLRGSAGRWQSEWRMRDNVRYREAINNIPMVMREEEEEAWLSRLSSPPCWIDGESLSMREVESAVGKSPRVLSMLIKGEDRGDRNVRMVSDDQRVWRYFMTGGLGGGMEHSDYLWRLQGEDARWRAYEVMTSTRVGESLAHGYGWDGKRREAEHGENGAVRLPSGGLETIGDEGNVDFSHSSDRATSLFLRTSARPEMESRRIGIIYYRPVSQGEVELGMRRFKCRKEGVLEALLLLIEMLKCRGTTLISALCAASDTEGVLTLARCGFQFDALHHSFFVWEGRSHLAVRLSLALAGHEPPSKNKNNIINNNNNNNNKEAPPEGVFKRLISEARLAHAGVPLGEHTPGARDYTLYFGIGKLGFVWSQGPPPIYLCDVVPGTQASKQSQLAADANSSKGPRVVAVGDVNVEGLSRLEIAHVIREAKRPVGITFRPWSSEPVEVERRSVQDWVSVLGGGWKIVEESDSAKEESRENPDDTVAA